MLLQTFSAGYCNRIIIVVMIPFQLDQQNDTHILELALIKSNSHAVSYLVIYNRFYYVLYIAISVEVFFVANWLIMV